MSVQLGLPKGFLPSPEVAMSNGCKSELVRVQPNNISTVQGPTQSIDYAVVSTAAVQIPFVSQMLQFSIPSYQGKNVWIDTAKSTLSFRANYAITNVTGSASNTVSAFLQAGAASWINRIVHQGPTGAVLDDVVNVNIAEHVDNLLTFNLTDRDCFASLGFGSDASYAYNYVQGHAIGSWNAPAATAPTVKNCYNQYEMPLPSSMIGRHAKGFFPIGAIPKLDIQLYTSATAPVTFMVLTAGAATTVTVQCSIDQIALNLHYVTLDDVSAKMIAGSAMHYVHGITSRVATGTLTSGTGYQNILCGLRAKSVRQLYARFVDAGASSSTTWLNGPYDSKAPLVSQLNFLLNGKDRMPKYPDSVQYAPMSILNKTIQSSERYKQWQQNSSFIPVSFLKYTATGTAPTAASGWDQNVVDAGATVTTNSLATFLFGCDLRVASSSEILDGYDLTSSGNHFLELNVLNAPSNSQTVYFLARCDVIYEIDMATGIISYRM